MHTYNITGARKHAIEEQDSENEEGYERGRSLLPRHAQCSTPPPYELNMTNNAYLPYVNAHTYKFFICYSFRNISTCPYIHKYTFTYTNIHTYINTYIHTYIQQCYSVSFVEISYIRNTCIHTCIHTFIHAYIHTHGHT